MELTVLQENLGKAVSACLRFISPHPTLPILSHILLVAKNGQLSLVSTNLEVGLNFGIGANIKKEGQTTVVARTLAEIIPSLPKDKIKLTQKEETFVISSGGYSVNLPTTPPNDFPSLPGEVSGGAVLAKSVFRDISRYITFAAAESGVRAEYSGVLFLKKDGLTDVVATDGVRLSKKTIEMEFGVEKIFVPARVLDEIPKIFQDENIKIFVDQEKNQVLFGGGNVVLTTRTLAAEFPDFEKIVPKTWETKIAIGKDDLLGAVSLASVFADDGKIEFSVSRNSLGISSSNPQSGSQKSEIPAKTEGDNMVVAFNWRYIRDFLGAVEGQEVTLELNNPTSPGVFRDGKDKSFFHLVMPIRIQAD